MRIHSLFIGLVMSLACGLAGAQGRATWIWFPGDFDIWLSNRMQVQHVERDVAWPPFWRLYNHHPQVNFIRQVDLAAPEDVDIAVEGVMFALLFGYLDEAQAASVRRDVLTSDTVAQITTPYMRFYELAALAESGQQRYVTGQIKDYWGGMLRAGATCFWEQYAPKVEGAARWAMYGKPFGISHAWGASPLYLLGKYYLGVRPTQPGYAA